MNDILKYDASFSESKFKSYVDNVFIEVHLALVTKELENVRHFVSDKVYSNFSDKLDKLNSKGLTQMYDEINVAQTDILDYKVSDDKILIDVNVVSKYIDYLIDSNGNYVMGNMNDRTTKNNHLVFSKKIGSSELSIHKCPGCGASIDVNGSGVCEYCGTTYNLADTNWILEDMG